MNTSRKRLNPEQRKQQLLDAAIIVFARRGIGRAAHADIAEETGVSVPTVFNYFKTREDLVDAVLNEVERFFIETAKSFHYTETALDDPLKTIMSHSFDFLRLAKDNTNLVKIWLEWGASVRDDSWPRFMDFQAKIIEIIAPTIQAGLDKGQMNSQLSAQELGQILLGQSHPVALCSFAPNQPISDMVRFVQLGMFALLGIKENAL